MTVSFRDYLVKHFLLFPPYIFVALRCFGGGSVPGLIGGFSLANLILPWPRRGSGTYWKELCCVLVVAVKRNRDHHQAVAVIVRLASAAIQTNLI
jgi:hypothetical protein